MMMASARRMAPACKGLALGTFLSLAPMLAQAAATDVFYERAVMTAAGERCALFTPAVAAALAAGKAQARGAALRGGAALSDLAGIEARATDKAASVACNSPDMATAAGRVRTAFDGYSRLMKMA
jgi:hypothetical protein